MIFECLLFVYIIDWVTDDLLEKVSKNCVLSKAFSDPALAKVLDDFHKDPQGALAAAQSKPEVMEFLKEFCNLMGDHFMSLDNKGEQEEELITEHLSEGNGVTFLGFPTNELNRATFGTTLKIHKKFKFDQNQLKLSTQHKNMYMYQKKL